MQYKRLLKMKLPKKQSAFLWGARKTGKSTYLHENFSDSAYFDLLRSDLYINYSKEPYLFREEVLTLPKEKLSKHIIIDEVQKIPLLLDEVHYLIENKNLQFILCGSSARKLRRGGANLLGGRAWGYHFYPLIYKEVQDFDLLKVFNHGLIPSHYLSSNPRKSIKSYVNEYLKEEIQAEGLVRNLPSFARFLDSLSYSIGELTNFSNIARDCGIDSKTVKEYYQILVDTMLGIFIYPYSKKSTRQTILSSPKFYLFDIGVANYLKGINLSSLKGEEAGKSLENFILMELLAYRGISDKDFNLEFWRTNKGLEVDFILGKGKCAIEVKLSNQVSKVDIKGLIAFKEENPNCTCYVVSQDPRPRKMSIENIGDISILPYKEFLDRLWNNEII